MEQELLLLLFSIPDVISFMLMATELLLVITLVILMRVMATLHRDFASSNMVIDCRPVVQLSSVSKPVMSCAFLDTLHPVEYP